MTSTDDLVVSLVIKDNSDLAKLGKQLKALVGTDGKKKIDIGKLAPGLARDVKQIKDKMNYLVPVVSPKAAEIERMTAYASSTKLILNRFRTELVSRLKSVDPKYLRNLYNNFDIKFGDYKTLSTTLEGIVEGFEEYLDEMQVTGVFTKGSKDWIDELNNFMRGMRSGGGKILTTLTSLFKGIPEDRYQERLHKWLGGIGAGGKREKSIYKIQKKFFDFSNKQYMDIMKKHPTSIYKKGWVGEDIYEELSKTKGAKPLLKNLRFGGGITRLITDIANIEDMSKVISKFRPKYQQKFSKLKGKGFIETKVVVGSPERMKKQIPLLKEALGKKLFVLMKMLKPAGKSFLVDEKVNYGVISEIRDLFKPEGLATKLIGVKETSQNVAEHITKSNEVEYDFITRLLETHEDRTIEAIQSITRDPVTVDKLKRAFELIVTGMLRRENLPE